MGTMKKFSFKAGGIKISADDKTIAGVLLAHALNESGVIVFDQENQTSATPELGQYWEGQGGIYVGDIRDVNGEIYHVISAKDDLDGEWVWGESGKTIEGVNSKTDGLANTIGMAKAESKLAKAAQEYTADGHEDFYLPSQCEAMLCFINAPDHFKKEAYWTSTQYSANTAWCQIFTCGHTGNHVKSAALRARAVRRFK